MLQELNLKNILLDRWQKNKVAAVERATNWPSLNLHSCLQAEIKVIIVSVAQLVDSSR